MSLRQPTCLLGIAPDEDFLTRLYQLICGYELGNWQQVDQISRALTIPPSTVGEAYLEAIAWAEQVGDSVHL